MIKKNSSQSGVALLISLGMLVLLSILGIAFATNMRLLERATGDFIFEVQARYLAEGGIEYAVAWLKDNARQNFVFNQVAGNDQLPQPPDLPTPADLQLAAGTDITIDATVVDTARQININNVNEALLATLPGIGAGRAADIVIQRDSMPNDEFLTKQSICLTSGITEDGIFNNIKDYITTDTYIDPNVQGGTGNRSAININTVTNDDDLLENILDIVSDVGPASAAEVATALMNNGPINSWDEFNTLVDGTGIDSDAKDNIKNAFNPNRIKPGGNIPTEFCFHSGGTYELNVTANITRGTQIIASKRITTVVELFNLWNMTTREQFVGEDVNYNGVADGGEDTNGDGTDIPEYARVTWLDSCPINIDECYQDTYVESNAETIADSLKIGYWDNFSEDSTFSIAQWFARQNPIDGFTDDYTITPDGMLSTRRDPGKDPSLDVWPIIDLGDALASGASGTVVTRRWQWKSISLRAHVIDEIGASNGRLNVPWHTVPAYWLGLDQQRLEMWQDVGQILFLKALSGSEAGEGFSASNEFYTSRSDPLLADPVAIDGNGDGDYNDLEDEYQYTCGLMIPGDRHNIGVMNPITGHINQVRHDGENPYNNDCDYGAHTAPLLKLDGIWNYIDVKPKDLPVNRVASTYNVDKDFYLYLRTYNASPFRDTIFSGKIEPADQILTADPANIYNKQGPGIITLYGQGNLPNLDTIRIISEDGYYISYPIDFGSDPHEWGTIFWTMTTPDTVDEDNEEVGTSFEVLSGGDRNFGNYDQWIQGVAGDIDNPSSSIGTGYGKTTLNHRYLKFKTFLECIDNTDISDNYLNRLSETPVLEDVWVTYLPKTKVRYWRDGGD